MSKWSAWYKPQRTFTLLPARSPCPKAASGALFAVLAGKIEVYKTIDGVERRLGWRLPGSIFGEVRKRNRRLAQGPPGSISGGDSQAAPIREKSVMHLESSGSENALINANATAGTTRDRTVRQDHLGDLNKFLADRATLARGLSRGQARAGQSLKK
jgi:hypothetical protein